MKLAGDLRDERKRAWTELAESFGRSARTERLLLVAYKQQRGESPSAVMEARRRPYTTRDTPLTEAFSWHVPFATLLTNATVGVVGMHVQLRLQRVVCSEDVRLARWLRDELTYLDVSLWDYLVVSRQTVVSLGDSGVL